MSTQLTRRELLKVVGLAGAGTLLASPLARAVAADEPEPLPRKGMWWVKEVDEPTTEIRWDEMKRFDAWRSVLNTDYADPEVKAQITKLGKETARSRELAGEPGYTTKDWALYNAYAFGMRYNTANLLKFAGFQGVTTPADRGVPRWEGTPEENAAIIQQVMRHMGAATVGFLHRDEKIDKLIYDGERDKKRIVFSDEEIGYETETTRVLPNKAEWVIVYTIQMSTEN